MTRRSLATTLALGAALAGPAAGQNRPQPPQTPPGQAQQGPQGQGQQPGGRQQQEGPRPYRDVITPQMRPDSGVFIVYRRDDRLYYEVPRAMFGREFLLVVDQRGTPRGVGYAGEEVTRRMVRWDRTGNRVLLRLLSYDMTADTTLPVSRAVRLSNLPQILRSFDVAAWSPEDSNAVIEVTGLFTQDVPELNARQDLGRRVRRFDPGRSLVERARSFPRNIEVSALQTYEVDSLPGAPGQRADGSVNTVTMLMNYSMVLLPDQPMMPRLCDNRIGLFGRTIEDYGRDGHQVARRCYLDRWRLEPSNPAAAVSDPVKPIVFYIDPATPEKWVPWLIRGVQMWEPVFRAAGFSNAIQARRVPTPEEDPEFDLDDARYSAIRWLPSTTQNAYGPHVSDPRTGEILQSNIGFYHNVMNLVRGWYWVQAGAVDPLAQRLPFPDSLIGRGLAYVAAHEVGHTLGMPHAMLSSQTYPVDSLRSRSFTCRYGTTASIMDYARFNYVAQPGDSACLFPEIGPFDYYTINWGYRRAPGATNPDAERPFLDSLARLQDTNPMFRYGRQNDPTDPRVQSEALGDDPVRATGYGLQNIRRLVPMLIPATTADRLQDYDDLNEMYGRLIGQWATELGHVAVVVGGVYRDEKYPSQSGVIYTPVPRETQAGAVRFLLENAFTTPTFFFDQEVLRRIEPSGSVDRIRVRQAALLNTVLNDARLNRLVEQEAVLPDGQSYTVAALLADLRRGLFSEAAAARPLADAYRRNIQRAFVDQLERLITTPLAPPTPPGPPSPFAQPAVPRPGDARALARAEMRDLDAQLRTAIIRTTDRETRAHFEDLRARIDRVLNPR
jgi:hypothetical protein